MARYEVYEFDGGFGVRDLQNNDDLVPAVVAGEDDNFVVCSDYAKMQAIAYAMNYCEWLMKEPSIGSTGYA